MPSFCKPDRVAIGLGANPDRTLDGMADNAAGTLRCSQHAVEHRPRAVPDREEDLAGGWRRRLHSGPMATRGFPLLVVGQFTSGVGDLCYAVALPWLILSGQGGGPVLLGTVLAIYGIARAVGIP